LVLNSNLGFSVSKNETLFASKFNDLFRNQKNKIIQYVKNKKQVVTRLTRYLTLFISESHPLFKKRYLTPAWASIRRDDISPYNLYHTKRILTLKEYHEVCLSGAISALLPDGLTDNMIRITINKQFEP